MIIPLDAEKAFEKIQHPIHAKSIGEIRKTRLCPHIIKAICIISTANVKLNGEIVESILVKSGARKECPLSSYPLNIALEILSRAIRQKM